MKVRALDSSKTSRANRTRTYREQRNINAWPIHLPTAVFELWLKKCPLPSPPSVEAHDDRFGIAPGGLGQGPGKRRGLVCSFCRCLDGLLDRCRLDRDLCPGQRGAY